MIGWEGAPNFVCTDEGLIVRECAPIFSDLAQTHVDGSRLLNDRLYKNSYTLDRVVSHSLFCVDQFHLRGACRLDLLFILRPLCSDVLF